MKEKIYKLSIIWSLNESLWDLRKKKNKNHCDLFAQLKKKYYEEAKCGEWLGLALDFAGCHALAPPLT